MIALHMKCPVDYTLSSVTKKAIGILKINNSDIAEIKILRESLDARKKPDLIMVLEVGVTLRTDEKSFLAKRKNIDAEIIELPVFSIAKAPEVFDRPLIVGFGPAGIFCALTLARAGYRPLVLERGRAIEDRARDVEAFWKGGKLNTESNVLFGEGGAGTFSDGKLNTLTKGSKDIQRYVMETFTEFGADEEICYSHKPHIGTDQLAEIIPKMRQEIIDRGGEVRFETKVTDIIIEYGKAVGLVANGEKLYSTYICLAPGHSARDTFRKLLDLGIRMEAKPFAVGVRCEHDQEMINISQYGQGYNKVLKAANYKLTAKADDGRGVYSFCMCPGGYVVNSSSEEGRLSVNGMSYHDRGSGKANSAIIVSVTPEDFGDKGPLSGLYWQEKYEEKAYEHRGGQIPVQTLKDYKENKATSDISSLSPCIKGSWCGGNLKEYLPDFISKAIEEGFSQFGRKIKGFDNDDTLLIGFESRTSSPVRIVRDDELMSIPGLYPCGEGAGYAGGITSAAVDGCRVAKAIAEKINKK